ncbi:MAG: dihydrolipoamide acetyltransferase family protein, partial [Chloroflexota bacterium]
RATPDGEKSRDAKGRMRASPRARRGARENGVELAPVTGTGPGGRIIKDDVQSFMRSQGAATVQQPPAASERARLQIPSPPPSVVPADASDLRAAKPVEMTRMQQTIARRMTAARFSAPDFVLTAECDMTDARRLLATISSTEGAQKVGPNDLLIKVIASALREHREVNAGWENDTIVRYGRVNVGVAVAVEDGLVVPVVRDADAKSLGAIARESKTLIDRARTGKLTPNDYEGGTFTISNLGMFGIDQFTPVINAPEACILGVGAIVQKPVVDDGNVVVRDRMRITLSCDHRVVYGAEGARFLQTVREKLERPMLTLL